MPHHRIRACAFLLLLAGCTVETESPDVAGQTVRLTILRTSDIHSRIFPYNLKPNSHDIGDGLYEETAPYGGVERLAALIARERKRAQRLIYVDSGDVFQGAPIFNYGDGEPEFRWLAGVGVDASVLGNHEFDKGVANLSSQAAQWISFPFLAANYIFDDLSDKPGAHLGDSVQPFTIVNVKGLKVGIIGLGDIGSMYSITEGGNSSGITPIEANETVRAYIELLSPATDLIVVLSHLGLREDQTLTNGHEIYLGQYKDVRHYLRRPVDPWRLSACPECYKGTVKYMVPGVRGIDAILGGHLHILTRPPMVLTDPAGRKVILEHPGAFSKYLTRLDLAVAVPHRLYTCDTTRSLCVPEDEHFSRGVSCSTDADCSIEKLAPFGAEVISHQQELFPIDSIWCGEPRPDPYGYAFGDTTGFGRDTATIKEYCDQQGHAPSRQLLEPYRVNMELDPKFDLTQIFGYAPKTIERKDLGTGGDSALGNMTALAMMVRKRVEAEFCVTNTLGIRDNLYAGSVNMETIFNIFPFENTITIMYLSGREVQELFDYATVRSQSRGCQSQVQIAGARFVMNCGQAKRNEMNYPCQSPDDCCPHRPEVCAGSYAGAAQWECLEGACYIHPAEDITIGGKPLDPNASYKMATNDYIARGGSGFTVLKRNTTKVDTGLAMRDALTEYLTRFPTCGDLLAADRNAVDESMLNLFDFSLSFCLNHQTPAEQRTIVLQGICTCGDVLDEDPLKHCEGITPPMEQFCRNPLSYPIIVGQSDSRIVSRVN